MTKNSSAVATSLRRRKASSRSRRTMQETASIIRARSRGPLSSMPDVLVRGVDDGVAARDVGAQSVLSVSCAAAASSAANGSSSSQSGTVRSTRGAPAPRAAAGPARACAPGHPREWRIAPAPPAPNSPRPLVPASAARDREVLGRRQVVLHRRGVPEVDELRAHTPRAARGSARPASAPRPRRARAGRTGSSAGWSCRCRSRRRCAAARRPRRRRRARATAVGHRARIPGPGHPAHAIFAQNPRAARSGRAPAGSTAAGASPPAAMRGLPAGPPAGPPASSARKARAPRGSP